MKYHMLNPALETLMFGVVIESLENGTHAEQHIIGKAFNYMHLPQHELSGQDYSEDFRGFDVGPYEKMTVKFSQLRLARTFFRAIRRELISSMPQIYLNASGNKLELPEDAADDDENADAAARDTARVKVIKINHGLYHSIVFVFSTKRERKPFLAVKLNINTDEYTTLAN